MREYVFISIVLIGSLADIARSQRRADRISGVKLWLTEPNVNLTIALRDTISFSESDSATIPCSRKIIVVAKEFGVGTLMGVGFSLIGAQVAGNISGGNSWEGFGPATVGAAAGFTVGYSYGVYTVAQTQKPVISFWGILASEIIGSAAGVGINSALNHRAAGTVAAIIFPLAFPIIYVELTE